MRLTRRVSCTLFPLALAGAAAAQSVSWEASDDGISAGVNLVFEDCEPEGTPVLPAIPGANFVAMGSTSSTRYRSGTSTKTITLNYNVVGIKVATLAELPAFWVKTSRGEQSVAAFTIRLRPPPAVAAKSQLLPARASVWAGEVFTLDYHLIAARNNNPQISPTFDWKPGPLLIEEWSKPDVAEAVEDGKRNVKVRYHTRAIAATPAKLKFEPASHPMSVQTGSVGSFFGPQPRMAQMTIVSDQTELEVRALPNPPEGFSGAVGQFTITTKIVPLTVAVGEPITWTCELKGTGNWPALSTLPGREISTDFEAVQPRPKWKSVDGKFFDGAVSEDVVLVPTKAGTYELSGVSFTYFDPATGSYQTSTTAGAHVTITEASRFAPPPYTGAQKAPPGSSTQKVGGTTFRNPADPASSGLSTPEQQLERIRNQDSPSRLYQLMRTDSPYAPKNDKN